ncbi:MAG: hypothetical protein IMX00_09675 [Limnochordales bacterium]|nr:hypothetical protein [Limnochordales bacterium]
MSADEPLPATVRVIPGSRRTRPVSRYLFGKFTEHLGQNVYGGAWAQITRNPEFAPIEIWPDRGEILRRLQAAATEFFLPQLAGGPAQGLPPWWVVERGPGMGAFISHSPDIRRGHWTLTLTSPAARGVQLVTPVYLPTHRTRQYTLRLLARGNCGIEVSLRTAEERVTLATASTAITATPAAANVTVALTLPEPQLSQQLPPPGTPYHLVLTLTSPGILELHQCLLFPADHIDGWDPDVIRFLREARLPLLRFPGGNFASGYHWEDGIGPVQSRPVLPNPAWPEVEWNHVGTDEWLHLCELVGCEPLICVNAGDGSPEEAARWVEYCNGSAETTAMGALRALNGHPEPYNVRLWEIGNELYGHWQIGHTDAAGYAERYRAFAAAMLAVDPTIHLIANGDTEAWNRTVVQGTRGSPVGRYHISRAAVPPIHTLSHHCLYAGFSDNADPERVYLEHMAFTPAYARLWHELVRPLEEAGLPPVLAITEQQVFTHRRHLPNNATLTEALWTASIINEAIRSDGLVALITHSALVNHGGGLRKEREIVYAQPVWWVTHLYARATATVSSATASSAFYRLELAVDSPTFSVEPYVMAVVPDAPFLDAVALTDSDEHELLFFLVNRHPHRPLAVRIKLPVELGRERFRQLETVTLTGASFMAANSWDDPDRVRPVAQKRPLPVGTEAAEAGEWELSITLPALSLVQVRLTP